MPEICPIFKWGDLDGAKFKRKVENAHKKCFGGKTSFIFQQEMQARTIATKWCAYLMAD